MAKDKRVEEAYKLEGKRRAVIRRRARAANRSLRRRQSHWPDEDSPTGYSQYCDYLGTCQYPCNGDC